LLAGGRINDVLRGSPGIDFVLAGVSCLRLGQSGGSRLLLRFCRFQLRRVLNAGDSKGVLRRSVLCFRLRELSLGLLLGDEIVARIDAQQQVAFSNPAVVIDVQFYYVSGDLRNHADDIAICISIVR
jgi:hypothetical protein